ncbi:Uncharacterised protein [Mycobacteroides abscessus]|nr:Uncharacterised protein [Mycobacteroides abscessus]SIJ35907.1 Uncharacterised protein [Mycobacteroides abscessus subsp. abscessus]CPS72947.1 Uncharacterised protein [Mycobacteroides abscessus]CPU55311.1 Uncharacterised protein [Mycobacteroides abscessus]CPU58783.1 Uncharacterised protein [Mycobacteroides abscessus]
MGRPFPEAERALALDTSVLAPLAAERLGRTVGSVRTFVAAARS